MAPTLDFYFDYSSPFGYLASTQVERVARDAGATLVWKPILLGGLFRTIGTPIVPLDAMPAPKRRHILVDMERWAEHWGVPLRFPTGFPLRTVRALRLTLAAPEEGRPALVHAIMRAVWVEDADPEADATLEGALARAELDVGLLSGTDDPEVKARLRALTDEAAERGAPGVPTFFVQEQGQEPVMFWGQDRLDFVAQALAGHRFPRG